MKNKTKLLMTVKDIESHRDTWLELKKNYISGTDAGVIMCESPWNTPLRLFHEKLGHIPTPDISNEEVVHFGTILEDVVAREFMARTGLKVRKCGLLADNRCNYRIANVDRLIIGFNCGLECKTTNAFNAEEWANGKVPRHYYYQCLHYMMTLYADEDGHLLPEYENARWFIACLIGGQKFVYREIPYNTRDAEGLAKAEKEFWNHLQEGTPPPVSNSPLDERTMGQLTDDRIPPKEIGPKLEVLIKMMEMKKQQVNDLKAEIQGYRNELLEAMDGADTAIGRQYVITYKARKPAEMVSIVDLRKQKAIYETVKNAGLIKTRPGTRSLIIKEAKNEG